MIGSNAHQMCEIGITRKRGGTRGRDGLWRPSHMDPYLPESFKDDYHPGGNSLCYMIQTAHLLGAESVVLLGFTLKNGTGYHFGLTNPVTRKRAFYETERPLHWLRWFESRYPGRVKLFPGWEGPLNEVFDEVALPDQEAEQPDPQVEGLPSQAEPRAAREEREG